MTVIYAPSFELLETKICKSCGEEKLLEEFPKHRRCKDGYYNFCKFCTNERLRISRNKNLEENRARSRKWQKDNPEWRRGYVNQAYRKLKDKIIANYGGKCSICGFSDSRALCIDHVNGNGLKERKRISAMGMMREIVKNNYPDKYQILCANCNQIKAIEKGEIPVSNIYRR